MITPFAVPKEYLEVWNRRFDQKVREPHRWGWVIPAR